MHLISMSAQTISVSGASFDFHEGETIFTESSYKYTLDEFASLARAAGWRVQQTWTDARKLFSVQYLSAE
jgi:uncharacterized SAM-dependent methyltransferase